MKTKIIQRQNISELETAINEFCASKSNVVSVGLSVTSNPTDMGLLADRNYHQYFYACILYDL